MILQQVARDPATRSFAFSPGGFTGELQIGGETLRLLGIETIHARD
jgi:hypothetical protein